MIEIPKQLQNENFRFCLVLNSTKRPFEDNWQDTNYKYNDIKLQNWLKDNNNYGVIGGYGNIVIIDIDDKNLAKEVKEKLDTFTVKTGSGGMHFYILSTYNQNHVFKNKMGELRASKYMVVGPNSIHPNGNTYSVVNNAEIKYLETEEVIKIIAPLIKDLETTTKEQLEVDKDFLEKNVLSKLNNYIFSLITQEKSKEELKALGFPSRSERDARIITSLLLNGFGSYIESIFETFPCGDKYREHSSKDKYIEHSIKIARNYSGVDNDYLINLEREIEELNDKLLKNKIDYFLRKIVNIEDWLLRTRILSTIAFRVKLKTSTLEKRLLEIISFSHQEEPTAILNLLNENIKSPEYWIDPIIPKNTLILVGGRPEGFKSMLVLSLVSHIKARKDFLNTFKIAEDIPRILYYDLENGKETQFWRLQYLVKGCNLEIKDFDNFNILFTFDKNNIHKEISRCKNYDIIVLDSYRRFLTGAEDKSEITNKFFEEFLYKLRSMGKTVIIIHHFRKQKIENQSSEDILDSFRGSGDIGAQLDIAYGVFKSEENVIFDNQSKIFKFDVSVIKAKVRNIFPIRNFTFSVERNDTDKSTKLDLVGFKKVMSPKDRRKLAIVELLKIKKEIEKSELFMHIKSIYDVTDAIIFRDLQELLSEGAISQPSRGFYKIK